MARAHPLDVVTTTPHPISHPTPNDPRPLICLGRTCLKWSADGELADPDRQWVLDRLIRVDAALASLLADDDATPGTA